LGTGTDLSGLRVDQELIHHRQCAISFDAISRLA